MGLTLAANGAKMDKVKLLKKKSKCNPNNYALKKSLFNSLILSFLNIYQKLVKELYRTLL